MVTSIQNGGLAAFPLIIAAIYSNSDDSYIPNVELFFVGLACLGFFVGLYLNYYDVYHDSVFNSPSAAYQVLDDDVDVDDIKRDPRDFTTVKTHAVNLGDAAESRQEHDLIENILHSSQHQANKHTVV